MLLIFGAGKAETGAIFQYRSFSQQFPRENRKLIIWIEWCMIVRHTSRSEIFSPEISIHVTCA